MGIAVNSGPLRIPALEQLKLAQQIVHWKGRGHAAYLACILCFVIVALLASFLNKFTNDFGLGKNGDFNIHFMQFLGLLTGLGAVAAIYQSIGSWRDSGRWIWAKIWNTLLALSVLFFFWFLFHWHLLNWNLNY